MTITPYILLALCALVAGGSVRVPTLDGRIVGGVPADISDYPYQLSLMYYGTPFCGASIISDEWVLTAAHCMIGTALSVRAGSSLKGSGGSVHQVVEIISHENYNDVTYDYDFALLRVSPKFNLGSPGIKSIRLSNSEPAAGLTSSITGWGALYENGPSSSQLQVVHLPTISRSDCRSAFGASRVTDRMICAGIPSGGMDSCQGDSGGPFMVNGQLAGVVSWGLGCARPGYPGVYSSVADQRQWIRRYTGL